MIAELKKVIELGADQQICLVEVMSYLVAVSHLEDFIATQSEISLSINCYSEGFFEIEANLAGHLAMLAVSVILSIFGVVVILQNTRLFEARVLFNDLFQYRNINIRAYLILNANG